jgi:hypothetical protein
MEYTPVESSNIEAVAYDGLLKELGVRFSGGSEYHYYEVEPNVYEEFLASASKGKYFHANIRNTFRFKKV